MIFDKQIRLYLTDDELQQISNAFNGYSGDAKEVVRAAVSQRQRTRDRGFHVSDFFEIPDQRIAQDIIRQIDQKIGNFALRSKIFKAAFPNTFRVGDAVSWSVGSDTHTGHVVKLTRTQAHVVEAKCELLNGSGSGEPDALTFSPGGFVGHTSGAQRWKVERGDGPVIKFSKRKHGEYQRCGSNYVGAPRLFHGEHKRYDFNF